MATEPTAPDYKRAWRVVHRLMTPDWQRFMGETLREVRVVTERTSPHRRVTAPRGAR